VDKRLALADQFLADAQDLLERGRLRSALSRAYYAVYHLCVLLFEKHELKPQNFKSASGRPAAIWEHFIITRQFIHQFVVKRKLFAWQRGHYIRAMFNDRISADYHPDIVFTTEYTQQAIQTGREFFLELRKEVTAK